MSQIITSILDNDLYKISMGQAVHHQYPNAIGKYVFTCRNKGVKLGFLAPLVTEQIEAMKILSLSQREECFLRQQLGFLTEDYLEYFRDYRFRPNQVNVENVNGDLSIEIDGLWFETIFWEVPILAIVNELYFRETTEITSIQGKGRANLTDKIALIRQYPRFVFAEFGTRRRYSKDWQQYVLEELKAHLPQLVGTSNIKFAMDFDIKPIGTQAHEWFMAHLGLVDNIEQAQKRALHVWLQEYDNCLGTALTDTFTTAAFFRDFGNVLANEFSGVRHDSGDAIEFGHNVINHYKNLGIDPRTKTIIFSDGLNVPSAIRIYKEFTGLIGVSFGIGTNLSNDLGATPLNIVIKLMELNGTPLVKLSDNAGKTMGDEEMVQKVKEAYKVRNR